MTQSTSSDLIRVAGDSPPAAVAGAIAKQIRLNRSAETQAIGVNAVNNMVKAAIIARSYLREDELRILLQPSFAEVTIDGRKLTAIHMHIWPCDRPEDGACRVELVEL